MKRSRNVIFFLSSQSLILFCVAALFMPTLQPSVSEAPIKDPWSSQAFLTTTSFFPRKRLLTPPALMSPTLRFCLKTRTGCRKEKVPSCFALRSSSDTPHASAHIEAAGPSIPAGLMLTRRPVPRLSTRSLKSAGKKKKKRPTKRHEAIREFRSASDSWLHLVCCEGFDLPLPFLFLSSEFQEL